MSVDDERFNPERNKMIEGKGNERFAKNRDERLGQIVGQWLKAFPEPGAEDKSLCDHMPNERSSSRFSRTALHRARGLRCQIGSG
jgi:hypothetical protein